MCSVTHSSTTSDASTGRAACSGRAALELTTGVSPGICEKMTTVHSTSRRYREPNAELVRPIHVTLVLRYALARLRGWWALTLAGRGPGAHPAPELDARITRALKAASRPRDYP